MIRIEPDTFYTRDDLKTLLEPVGINPDFFIGRLKPRKVFRMVFRGADILEAYARAPELREDEANGTTGVSNHGSSHKIAPRARKRPSRRNGDGANLIGGVFSPERLGLRTKN